MNLALVLAAAKHLEAAAWGCLVFGAVLVAVGAVAGLKSSGEAKGTGAKAAAEKVTEVKSKVSELQSTAVTAAKSEAKEEAAATKAGATGNDAEAALKDLEGIVASLPEGLRFAGLLVLFGGLLMSVSLIQLGGQPIF